MKCTVKERLLHDGKTFKPGEPVELSEEQAASLIALDVVTAPKAGKAKDQ